MKRFLSSFVVTLFTLSLFGQKVTEEVAMRRAVEFLGKTNSSERSIRRLPRKAAQLKLACSCEEFYVFNDKANGGYVIVSGDERTPAVLGYSLTGHYDEADVPVSMRSWLNGYAEQIRYVRTHGVRHTTAVADAIEGEEILPLLDCSWGQNAPYNGQCPIINESIAPTGCVATAMAQIMYYHQWPRQTTKAIPGYITRSYQVEVPEIGVTTIDWANILPNYTSGAYNATQAEAVATLTKLCGASISMNYGPTSSGGYSSDVPFYEYFGYLPEYIQSVSRNGSSDQVWNQQIYDELKEKRVVLYHGESGDAAHSFVVDGYDRDDYFHVNWGWSGRYNGYFLLSALRPGSYNYDYNQGAVIGIVPLKEGTPRLYAMLENGTLTFYYDDQYNERSGTLYAPIMKSPWLEKAAEITACVIDPSFKEYRMKFPRFTFSGLKKLTAIRGLENLNTDVEIGMSNMFSGCQSLTELDLRCLNTENVVNMRAMFKNCSSLVTLDLSSFNTEKVTNMASLFENCTSLQTIYVGDGWNMDKVNQVNRRYMFRNCQSLVGEKGTKYIDVGEHPDMARVDGGAEAPGYFTYRDPHGDGIESMDNGQWKMNNGKWTMENVIYNLSGQRLTRLQRGVNIINGKKVIIK